MDGMIPDDSAPLIAMLRRYDLLAIALDTMHRVDELRPYSIPLVNPPSAELAKALDMRTPGSVPDGLQFEHEQWCAEMMARVNAKAENKRMLRATLWAEAYLRQKGRAEHAVLRAFNEQCWGVPDEASADYSVREAQAKACA
jgi:hypothetical protein